MAITVKHLKVSTIPDASDTDLVRPSDWNADHTIVGTNDIANGGTNSTATPTAGAVAYGTGTAYAFSTAGTAGQVLQSNGSSAPSWVASPAAGAGGANTQIQFNNSGVLAGNSTYTMVSGVMKENGFNFVSQADVGSSPNQVPLNQYLGNMAYQDDDGVNITGGVINGVINGTIGATTPATGIFTTVTATTTMGVGNATPSTSGSGITFPATQSASTNVNTLDDYEEGTWSPVISDGTNNATMDSTTSGTYTKIGNTVNISAYIITTSLGSVSGAIRVIGLPFAVSNANNGVYSGTTAGWANQLLIIAGQSVGMYADRNTTQMPLFVWNATSGSTAMTSIQWTNVGAIIMNLTYKTT
jgi:hypothetical protein